jgi:carbamoyltransferase
MKLLSLALQEHDANFSYFDGNDVHYHKLERTKSSKHYGSMNVWEWKQEIKQIWNISENDVDEIVIRVALAESEFEKMELQNVLVTRMNTLLDLSLFVNPNKTWYMKHHYAHALSGWMLYDKEPDVYIVVDGLGDKKTWSVFRNDKLIDSGDLDMGSIGFLMMEAGKSLGIECKFDDDYAGKVMGLQSYGNLDNGYLAYLNEYNSIKDVNQIFSIDNWVAYKKDNLLANLTPLDWIRTVHHKMEQVMINFFKQYAKEDETIFYSGGVAQNVIWNTALKNVFKNLIIAPHSTDEGLSLGGLEWLRRKNNLEKFKFKNFPYVQSDEKPDTVVSDDAIKYAARLLSEGKVIAWYQGNGEIGPRALGNRSILMDPRIVNGKEKINSIKRRENYRPFGASVLREHAEMHFDLKFDDEYMLHVTKVISNNLDAITHVDGTCRLQTVTKNSNGSFYKLLGEFYNLTGCPVLLNTSLNLAGKPIAGHVDEAKQLFLESNIDCLFIGNQYYIKT